MDNIGGDTIEKQNPDDQELGALNYVLTIIVIVGAAANAYYYLWYVPRFTEVFAQLGLKDLPPLTMLALDYDVEISVVAILIAIVNVTAPIFTPIRRNAATILSLVSIALMGLALLIMHLGIHIPMASIRQILGQH